MWSHTGHRRQYIRRMRFVWWTTGTTDTHSEYITLFALERQQWLRERSPMLGSYYISCFVCVRPHYVHENSEAVPKIVHERTLPQAFYHHPLIVDIQLLNNTCTTHGVLRQNTAICSYFAYCFTNLGFMETLRFPQQSC